MARAPGTGDLPLYGRESHIPCYRSAMLRLKVRTGVKVAKLTLNSGVLFASMSASAENCNKVLAHD